jgi:hypothetical protein
MLLYLFVTAAYLGFRIVELIVHSCILHCVMGYYVSQFLVFKKGVHILAANNVFPNRHTCEQGFFLFSCSDKVLI